ncbi:hypothetical protein ACFPIF_11645 [Brevundimonas faecalis]|uniref:hypothetical protein n=1 Tax=Brevundimonas faecalis TaxID=947378 RepID=UPI0036090B9C
MREAAANYTANAVATLAEIMQNSEHPAAARVSAANALLDRAHGKPKQAIDVDGLVNGALTVTYVGAPLSPATALSDEDYETEG